MTHEEFFITFFLFSAQKCSCPRRKKIYVCFQNKWRQNLGGLTGRRSYNPPPHFSSSLPFCIPGQNRSFQPSSTSPPPPSGPRSLPPRLLLLLMLFDPALISPSSLSHARKPSSTPPPLFFASGVGLELVLVQSPFLPFVFPCHLTIGKREGERGCTQSR